LVHSEDRLLFILYDVKVYPLQEILAFEFGMVQSTANEWIQLLSVVLKKALDHGGYVSVHVGAGHETCSPASMPRMMTVHEHHTTVPT
jgi:hypothetical protein